MLKNPVVVDIQVRRKETEVRNIPERNYAMDEHKISHLFKNYFNNKMTLLLFLIQTRGIKPNPKLVETVGGFLDDLFRHMLEGALQKRYRLVFKWLKRFFAKMPDVSMDQRDKARDFIRAIYDALGLHLKDDI